MTKTKSTKRALLMSGLALMMCIAMLIGTTYAWFTDSVTSSGNKIKAGTLDIQLLMDADVDGKYDDISNSTSPIFGEGSIAQNNNAETLWEPGKTQVAYLAIKNNGNLDLKYTVGLDVQNVSNNLYEVMEYAIVPNADANNKVQTWTSGNSVVVGTQSVSGSVPLKAGATHYFALAIHMNEEAGNKYQGGEVAFDLTVLATQLVSEYDSFDNTYDEDATFGTYIELDAGEDLLAAMASAKADIPLNIKLNGDVEWPTEGHHGENDITPASSIVIDGNGYTITATGAGVTPLGDKTVPMTLKNVTIVDNSVSYNESAWELSYLEMGGRVLNCLNVNFVDPITVDSDTANFVGCTFVGHYDKNSTSTTQYGVWVSNGDATFTDCTFTGTRGLKICDQYAPEVGTVIVDGCTFNGISEKPGVVIDDEDTQDMKITIKNSTFINCQPGDQGKYIYETDNTVPTVENNTVIGGTEIVDGVYENGTRTYYVYTAEGLQNVFAEVIPQNKEQSQSVNLMADIDLSGIIWQPTNNMHFTFNGNGHTISNVTCAEGWRSGFFGYAGGVKVNDLTLENVTAAGAQAGTFAGSAEGFTATNCFLKGTNTVTYAPYADETWGGVGAVTGVVSGSNINITIVEGTTVTISKSGLTTQSKFIDNLTGYLNANNGKVVNNGTVKVIDLAIATADELFAFAKDVNENGKNYSGKTVVLVADIDLENKAWTPIGQTGATEFKGTFDGNNHIIKNLFVDNSAYDDEHTSTGLFGWAESNVTIQNVKVDGANVTGNHNVAVIVGYTYSGKITNCHVSNATVVCKHANDEACGDKAGTIAGYTADESRITNCSATDSTVKAGRDAGQIVGLGYTKSISNCTATNVTVSANGTCPEEANIKNAVIGRVMG